MTTTQHHESLEAACSTVERSCATLAQTLKAAMRAERALAKAAAEGDLAKIRKGIEALAPFAAALSESSRSAVESWSMSPDDEERYLSERGGYEHELTDAARAEGVRLDRLDDRLSAFPVLLKIVPSQRALRIDAKRITALRPSRVIAQLRAAQSAKGRLAPERFLEVLFDGYRQIVGTEAIGKPVRLVDVYDVLTLHPDMRKSYDKAEFTRDLHGLDRSAIATTKSGHRLSLPSATGEKSRTGVLSIVGTDGRLHKYSGIRFEETER